ncbi:ABC-2 family transporter protein [compost metagenome]
MLTKPVSRSAFLIGKLLGLAGTLTVLVAAMGASYLGLLLLLKVPLTTGLFQAIGFTWLELIVLTALTMVFSTFSTPVLCMLYAFAIYFIGHNAGTLKTLAERAGTGMRELLLAAYYLLPNLATFDIKNQAVYGYAASPQQVAWTIAYAGIYAAMLFSVAVLIFRRREF